MSKENCIPRIRIAFADDHALVVTALLNLLKPISEFEVIFTARSGDELLQKLEDHEIDVVLLDINMPVKNGLECIPEIKRKFPLVKIIVLTVHDTPLLIAKTLELGANSFLLKSAEFEEFQIALRSVYHKGYYFTERVSKVLHQDFIKSRKINPIFARTGISFSEHEIKVIEFTCLEMTSKAIAKELCISERTVENHRKKIMTKIGCKNLTGVVVFAFKNGIMTTEQ